jgi:hypothetical protein
MQDTLVGNINSNNVTTYANQQLYLLQGGEEYIIFVVRPEQTTLVVGLQRKMQCVKGGFPQHLSPRYRHVFHRLSTLGSQQLAPHRSLLLSPILCRQPRLRLST